MSARPQTPLLYRAGMAFDRALSVLAPSLALRRMDDRFAMSKRMYAAAKPTQDAGGWLPYDGDVNSLIRSSSPVVRARARQLVRDFPYARRAIRVRTDLVIGNGIRMQARLKNASGDLDVEANKRFEGSFAEWAQKASLDGRLSFAQLQRLAERQAFEAGEYVYIKHITRDRVRPLRLQPIEADRLAGNYVSAPIDSANAVRDGIEYNKKTGERIAYHFLDDGYSAKTIRVPADMVIHGYDVERPEQMRGISCMAAAIMVAGNLADMLESELDAMRMATRLLAFVRRAELPGEAEFGGKKTKGKNTEHFAHATIQYIKSGEDIELAKIDRQSGTFEPFLKFNIRTFAVACGLTYELVSGDYQHISYSNLRGIRNDLAFSIRPIQRSHIDWLCRPVGRAWLETSALADPRLTPYLRRLTPDAFTWIAPGMESADPLREVRAHSEEIKQGTRSPQEICRVRGRDFSEVVNEIAEAKAYMESKGLTMADFETGVKTSPSALMEE